ncbi:MAG: hypothetical protein J4400_05260 [Candidatus Aenigmarchaeota archaeon]|nr:hypothetical protein [Candidatus Aenigmarchaeota archaeon]
MDCAIESDRATRKYLERAERGLLPQYGSPSTRDGWVPDFINYDMETASDTQKIERALITGMAGGAAAALTCMAQSYGAIDSNIVSETMELFGGPVIPALGAALASYPAVKTAGL